MTRYLLDTDIISGVTTAVPSPPLIEWLAEQLDEDLFISSLSLAEIRRGVLQKPAGKKRRQLEEWFQGPEGPQALFRGRVLPFDETGITHLGSSYVGRHRRRTVEECFGYGHSRDRRSERLHPRHGQRETRSWHQDSQSAP